RIAEPPRYRARYLRRGVEIGTEGVFVARLAEEARTEDVDGPKGGCVWEEVEGRADRRSRRSPAFVDGDGHVQDRCIAVERLANVKRVRADGRAQKHVGR